MRKLILLITIAFCIFITSCTQKSNKTISFMTWGSQSEINVIKTLIKEFEDKNKKINVELIHVPDNYFQKLHLLVASNLMPDVIFINNLNLKLYTDAKKIEPLNNYIEKSSSLKKNDFIEQSFSPVTYNDNIYVLPRDISNLVIYYNKNLFQNYNVPFPKNDWTIQNFLQLAQKLTIDKNSDGQNDIWGFGFEENSLFWLPFLMSNGGGILKDSSSLLLNSENSKKSLQFYSDLKNKYKVTPQKEDKASLTNSQLFLQEKLAMHICGKWCSLTYQNNATFDWDVINFPNGANGSKVPIDISGWAISSQSKNKQLAWEFIEFLSSDYSIKKITETGLIFPAKKNIANTVFLAKPPKNAKAFILSTQNSIPTPVCQKYNEINNLLNQEFELLFNGKKTVNEIINPDFIEKLNDLTD